MNDTEIKFTHTNQLIAYINQAKKHSKNRYSESRFGVLIALVHHLNMKTLSCYPSNARIAAMANIPLRTVERIIKEFETSGLIKSKARYNASSIRSFDLSKLAVTVGGLTTFNKLKLLKEQITTNVEVVTVAFKELTQAIQKAAYKRGSDAMRAVFTKKHKLDSSSQRQKAHTAMAKAQEEAKNKAQELVKQFNGRFYTESEAIMKGFVWE